ncbi:hypothetical protein EDD29_0133 [Actinocorallia herbida]|uniref:Uncharacterized protein n=1 Tax=Actinocorallia herbida TaxID=58109 RepID=A0A3N1CMX2_9ACTN|nr:hypothetical protein [Actinocorallia herbida]ROO82652.1 hypothetical protein EDD29_0133 [Actinocorallia herbida]
MNTAPSISDAVTLISHLSERIGHRPITTDSPPGPHDRSTGAGWRINGQDVGLSIGLDPHLTEWELHAWQADPAWDAELHVSTQLALTDAITPILPPLLRTTRTTTVTASHLLTAAITAFCTSGPIGIGILHLATRLKRARR